jgi:hypothetical protein
MTEPHPDDRSEERAPRPPDEALPTDPALGPGDETEDEHPLEADYPDADDPDPGDTD